MRIFIICMSSSAHMPGNDWKRAARRQRYTAPCEYYVVLSEAAKAQIRGPEQSRWLERLERDHDNIRAALAWSTHPSHHAAELGLRLCAHWVISGYARPCSEGRRWLQAALELPAPSSSAGESPNARLEREHTLLCALRSLWLRGPGHTSRRLRGGAFIWTRGPAPLQQTGNKPTWRLA